MPASKVSHYKLQGGQISKPQSNFKLLISGIHKVLSRTVQEYFKGAYGSLKRNKNYYKYKLNFYTSNIS